jgi:hypothetical protein
MDKIKEYKLESAIIFGGMAAICSLILNLDHLGDISNGVIMFNALFCFIGVSIIAYFLN